MAYTKQTWTDGTSGGTPVSAARPNYIEDGIFNTYTKTDADAGFAPKLQSINAQTGTTHTQGYRSGDGQIILTW